MNRDAKELEKAFGLYNSGRHERALKLFRALSARRTQDPSPRLYAAHCLLSLGKLEPARAAFARLAAEFPGHAPAADGLKAVDVELERRLRERLAGGDREAALPLWTSLAGRAAGRLDDRLGAALWLLRGPKGPLASAFASVAAAGAEPRRSAEASLRLAQEELRTLGRAGEAAACARAQAGLDPEARPREEARALGRQAARAAAKRSWSRAVALLRRAQRLQPQDLQTRVELCMALRCRAEQLRDAGRWSQSLSAERGVLRATDLPSLWTPAEGRDGQNLPALRGNRFQSLLLLGRYEEAFAEGERALDLGPTLAQLRVMTGPWDALHLDRVRGHRPKLESLARRLPRSPWPAFYLSLLLEDQEGLGLEPVVAVLAPVLAAAPRRYGWMLSRAAHVYLGKLAFPEALRLYARSLAYRPVEWRARAFSAEALLCLGRREDALREVTKALDEAPEPDIAEVLAWRAELRLWLGRYGAALKDADAACERGGLGGAFALTWRAGAKLLLGRPAQALEDLEEALRRNPRDREAAVWRGETLRILGRPRQALAALDRGPDWTWARINRALAKDALGDEKGFAAEFARLPPELVAEVAARLGLPAEGDAAWRRRLLNGAFALAKGFRREQYQQRVWLGP